MPPSATVLLAHAVGDAHRIRLRAAFPDVRFVGLQEEGGAPAEGRAATALLRVALSKPQLSRALDEAPDVRWVHTSTAGFDWALVPEIGARGIVLTRSAASYAIPIGEFVLALVAAHAKRLGALAAMRPGAYLIDVARGPIVDMDALLEALHARRLAGAALDAFDEEPLPADHPIWDAPGATVTPHTSFKSARNLDRVVDEFAANLRRFLDGEPLHHALRDATLGY